MSGKKLVVTIDDEGNATLDAVNFHGIGCKTLTDSLNAAYGGKITKNVIKREINDLVNTGTLKATR